MKNSPTNVINRFLERRGLWLSRHATLTLTTLILLLGITAGFVRAATAFDALRPPATPRAAVGMRSADASRSRCAQVAVDLDPAVAAAGIRQLMQSADAVVTDGPDASGHFQLRLAQGVRGAGMTTHGEAP